MPLFHRLSRKLLDAIKTLVKVRCLQVKKKNKNPDAFVTSPKRSQQETNLLQTNGTLTQLQMNAYFALGLLDVLIGVQATT